MKIFALVLLFFSGLLIADTIPATPNLWHRDYGSFHNDGTNSGNPAGLCVDSSPYTVIFHASLTSPVCDYLYQGTFAAADTWSVIQYGCPSGGTVSGTDCINVPSCPVGQYRNATTYACQVPVFCLYPEVDDGTGHCAVPAECAAGKKYQYTTLSCQTPPTCAATESFNAYVWACQLKILNCPGHSHANTGNDQCLSDAPLTCPTGQHDDGTYLCVANDAVACTSNQVKGYIFGIPQCINKTNVDEFAKQAADVAATKAATDARVATSQAAADAAAATLAADPTNTTKQDANNAAQAANALNLADQDTDSKASDQAQKNQDSAALKSISDSVKNMDEKDDADRQAGFGTIPDPDVIGTSAISLSGIPSGSSSGTCPAPNVVSTSHGELTMSYQPYCNFATSIAPLVLIFAYFAAGAIVLGPLKG